MKLLGKIVLRQLWARRGLNAIAAVGVLLGVLTLVAISGIMDGAGEKFFSTILQVSPHIVVRAERLDSATTPRPAGFEGPSAIAYVTATGGDPRRRIQRPVEMADAIEKLEGVVAASPFAVGTGIVASSSKTRPVELRGVDFARQDRVTPLHGYVVSGSYASLAATPDSALIGTLIAADLGVKVGDRITCVARGQTASLRVAAVFETTINAVDKGRLYVNLRQAQSLLRRGDGIDGIDGIEIRVGDPTHAPEITTRIERVFGYDAESWQQVNANFLGLLAQQGFVVNLVIGALLAVGGFGILAVQIMIVGQKRRDIAILRSVGFRRADILQIFLAQGVAIAFVGSLFGSLFGHFALVWLRTVKAGGGGGTIFRAEFMPIQETWQTYLSAAAFSLVVGALASLLPAWRASRVDPIDVLRGQL